MNNRAQITRKELYDRIWATHASCLVKEFGMSDVGLSKICKRNGIPKPGPGYWARIAHGQIVKKEPLPSSSTGQLDVIEISVEAIAETQ